MRPTLSIAVVVLFWAAFASAQDVHAPAETTAARQRAAMQPRQKQAARVQGAAKKPAVPSIIQSELDRSRAEETQHQASARVQSAPREVPAEPAWPLFAALGFGTAVTVGLLLYFHRRKNRPGAQARRQDTPAPAPEVQTPAAPAQPAPVPQIERAFAQEDDDTVTSSSPYVSDDNQEMPEAALTMNLLNKKRETKKELILEVMKRVQRKENPQHIAEALRIGIGEVHLAMTLAKLKK